MFDVTQFSKMFKRISNVAKVTLGVMIIIILIGFFAPSDLMSQIYMAMSGHPFHTDRSHEVECFDDKLQLPHVGILYDVAGDEIPCEYDEPVHLPTTDEIEYSKQNQ